MNQLAKRCAITLLMLPVFCVAQVQDSGSNRAMNELSAQYLDHFTQYSPVSATLTGDHRYDGDLDPVSAAARADELAFVVNYLLKLGTIDRSGLSRENQVDAALLENALKRRRFELTELQEWAWNPLRYTALAGNAVYGLMAREFAPLAQRLGHVADRLEQFPRLLEQVRATLEPSRVPAVHAQTAIRQNRGVLSVIDNFVVPSRDVLDVSERQRLAAAIDTARAAVESHQQWLENDLLPAAKGDFRIGKRLYDRKLALTLQSVMDREAIASRASQALAQARNDMFAVAQGLYRERYPLTRFPDQPDAAYRQAIIRAALEMVYEDRPQRGGIVAMAREHLAQSTAFVRDREIVTVPDDPVEIIVMPEFRRGIALAYCDSPGPLDAGQKTFYAVSPLPADWTPEQDRSFLREYNAMGVQVLTIHEAMPGHYLQIAHANQYPSKLRAVLSSGAFIEGWAVYTEGVMQRNGYLDSDPRFHLIQLKLLVRAITNAMMDQAIHAGDMSREQAMRLMVEQGFQEEREAAGKWVRAQLTAAQLSTYFVGYLEHSDLRETVESASGDEFELKSYHDQVLSYGAPPVHYVRALMLDKPIAPPGP